MSIQTRVKPENTKIRAEKSPILTDSTNAPISGNGEAEVEISIPALLMIIIGLGVVIFGGIFLYNKGKSADNGGGTDSLPNTLSESLVPVEISLDYVDINGNENAEFVYVEYSDFECPYCKMFATGWDPSSGLIDEANSSYGNINKMYVEPGTMKYGYVPYIGLESHKPAITEEVLAYYCARDQGKEIEMAHQIFTKTITNGYGLEEGFGINKESIYEVAKEIGLDDAKFKSCYEDRKYLSLIDENMQKVDEEVRDVWASKFGLQNFGTPFFAICKISSEDPNKCVGSAFVGAWPFEYIRVEIDNFIEANASEGNN